MRRDGRYTYPSGGVKAPHAKPVIAVTGFAIPNSVPKGIRLSHEKGRRLLPASSHTSARLTSVAFLGLLALLLVLVFALILILILVLVLILILVLIVLSHTEHLLFLTVYALSVP